MPRSQYGQVCLHVAFQYHLWCSQQLRRRCWHSRSSFCVLLRTLSILRWYFLSSLASLVSMSSRRDAASADAGAEDLAVQSILCILDIQKVSLWYATVHVFLGALGVRMIWCRWCRCVVVACQSSAVQELSYRWQWILSSQGYALCIVLDQLSTISTSSEAIHSPDSWMLLLVASVPLLPSGEVDEELAERGEGGLIR